MIVSIMWRQGFLRLMSTFATPKSWTTAGTAEAVALPRRHLVAIAILMCVPLPLFSLAAAVVPLPQMVERVAATFISIAAPALDGDGSVIRESRIAVRSVEIVYAPRFLRRSARRVSSCGSRSCSRSHSVSPLR